MKRGASSPSEVQKPWGVEVGLGTYAGDSASDILLRQGSLTPHLLRWGGIVVHSHPIDTANRHVHNRGCTSLPGVWEEGP